MIQITTSKFILTIRPSGTEPKLKIYCQILPEGVDLKSTGREMLAELRAQAEGIAAKVYGELLGRIDAKLGPIGLLLPDIIDLGQKQDFEARILPELKALIQGGQVTELEPVLSWLGDNCQKLLPGADPRPALKSPLAQWLADENLGNTSAGSALMGWAKA